VDNAFSGLKLSEAAAPTPGASLDQRLFLPSPAVPAMKRRQAPPKNQPAPLNPAAPKQRTAGAPVPRVPGQEVAFAAPVSIVETKIEQPLSAPDVRAPAPFDINARPYRKDSFLFTDDEFNRLEDLKLELRRRHDLPATKNDIARIAFHLLFEDYGRDPAKSRVLVMLRKKRR